MNNIMHIYVFSYNRGRYLHNCLSSIMKHASQYSVTVVDDGSTDSEVKNVLQEFKDKVTIVHTEKSPKNQYSGGLKSNMQYVLDLPSKEKLALFLQDDQQIVRDLDQEDEEHWERFFESYPEALILAINFLKADASGGLPSITIDHDIPVYFRDPSVSRRAHYSDTGIFHKERMQAIGWRFQAIEGWDEDKARKSGYKMGVSPYPFMMWLPNAESVKFQRKGMIHRFAEWYRRVGFYPYEDMIEDEVSWLRARDISKLPIAQDILRPEGLQVDQRWLFEDATKSIRFIHRYFKKKKKKQAAQFKD